MADTSIIIRDANGVEYPVDVRSIPGGDTRQVLLIGDGENSGLISPATEDTLTAILTELGTKLDAGGTVTVGGTVSIAQGTFAYAAGTAPATVDVPVGARVKRVSVIAGAGGAATVTIAGGATITIPAGGSFDEQLPGDVAAGADVVIGGTVASYYVGWVA